MARSRRGGTRAAPSATTKNVSSESRDLGLLDPEATEAALDALFALRDEDPALACLERAARGFHRSRAAKATSGDGAGAGC